MSPTREASLLGQLPSSNRLFIGSLPMQVTATQLRAYFEYYHVVSDAVVIKDPTTKRSRCFGFVSFPKGRKGAAAVRKCLADYYRHRICGKWVKVERAIPLEELDKKAPASDASTCPSTPNDPRSLSKSTSPRGSPAGLKAKKRWMPVLRKEEEAHDVVFAETSSEPPQKTAEEEPAATSRSTPWYMLYVSQVPSEDSACIEAFEFEKVRPNTMKVERSGSAMLITDVIRPGTCFALLTVARMRGLQTSLAKDLPFEDAALAEALWSRVRKALPKALHGCYLDGFSAAMEVCCCPPQASSSSEQLPAKFEKDLMLDLCLQVLDDVEPNKQDTQGLRLKAGQALLYDAGLEHVECTAGLSCVMLRLRLKYGAATWWAAARAALGTHKSQLFVCAIAAATAITAAGIVKKRSK